LQFDQIFFSTEIIVVVLEQSALHNMANCGYRLILHSLSYNNYLNTRTGKITDFISTTWIGLIHPAKQY
jgi:hypothetical protein